MAAIFNSLYTGYSGLNASQVGIDTTGHNITNAEVDGYTRQRVVYESSAPMATSSNLIIGNGVDTTDIKRVYDDFVFTRYTDVAADKEYSDYETDKLETVSTYFPDVDGVGIKSDLSDYYDSWQNLADNPDNISVKTDLEENTENLSSHIQETRDQVYDLQKQVNDDLALDINEVNKFSKELAQLNKSIDAVEVGGLSSANDLRDRRNVIEKNLSRLIGAKRTTDQLKSNIQIDSSSNTLTGSYTIQVNGFNIVDGGTYHPLHLEKDDNPNGFYDISYQRQDGTLIPMSEDISDGEVGAMLDLRGHTIDSNTGVPNDGTLQDTINELDSFSAGLIESTNNLYAAGATTRSDSNVLELNGDTPLVNSKYNIKEGSFNLVVYNSDGDIVSTRAIGVDAGTTMNGNSGSNSIEAQVAANKDDNDDGDASNDIDDYLNFNYNGSGNPAVFTMDPEKEADGYTFAIEDNLTDNSFDSGSNFAGAFGFSRYFDGSNAKDIRVNQKYRNDPSQISAGKSTASGDKDVATDMVQQQYEKYDFDAGNHSYNTTTYGMFDIVATNVGTKTNTATIRNDTINAQYNATEMEYFSTSKVNTDEEMTNLIKYQTAYGAAAKIITTIDQMTQTLLGIKQ